MNNSLGAYNQNVINLSMLNGDGSNNGGNGNGNGNNMSMMVNNVNSSIMSVREILQKALLANAVSIFIMHNHPSGDPTPSREDIQVTERLIKAGEIVGVQVLDHIIIGRPGYVSLKDKGYI
jgi:DNA repair protein RadC